MNRHLAVGLFSCSLSLFFGPCHLTENNWQTGINLINISYPVNDIYYRFEKSQRNGSTTVICYDTSIA